MKATTKQLTPETIAAAVRVLDAARKAMTPMQVAKQRQNKERAKRTRLLAQIRKEKRMEQRLRERQQQNNLKTTATTTATATATATTKDTTHE